MNWITGGADIATMATGLSAVTAAATWIAGRWRGWRQEKALTAHRNWHGYIPSGTIASWHVRLAEEPDTPSAKVVLEVVDRDGNPDPYTAPSLRRTIDADGKLARVPTPQEYEFLGFLSKKFGYGKGVAVPYMDT